MMLRTAAGIGNCPERRPTMVEVTRVTPVLVHARGMPGCRASSIQKPPGGANLLARVGDLGVYSCTLQETGIGSTTRRQLGDATTRVGAGNRHGRGPMMGAEVSSQVTFKTDVGRITMSS